MKRTTYPYHPDELISRDENERRNPSTHEAPKIERAYVQGLINAIVHQSKSETLCKQHIALLFRHIGQAHLLHPHDRIDNLIFCPEEQTSEEKKENSWKNSWMHPRFSSRETDDCQS